MKGKGTSHGAATIVNAIAGGKGAAFGLDLRTEATVELTTGKGTVVTMDGLAGESGSLVERCVHEVLALKGGSRSYHAEVMTSSQIPVSRGLKSSSAAANAVIMATLDALGETMDEIEAIRIGTRAAIEAGVSITGAFDDACACALGGVVLTDNRSETILFRGRMPDYVKALVHVPPRQIRKDTLPRAYISSMTGLVDLAFHQALEGDYYRALTLNGMCYSTALGLDQTIVLKALQRGALAAGLTGTGPATVMLVVEDKVREFTDSMKEYELMVVDIYNGEGDG
jgi:shikimate kinase